MPDYGAVFTLGLVYGLTVCSMSCLPYMAPIMLGSGDGFRKGLIDSLCFVAGKLAVYSALGGVAALIGDRLDLAGVNPWLMGLVLIVTGIAMLLVKKRSCRKNCQTYGKRFSLLALGAGSSLIPCPPLAAVFMLAAQQGDIASGTMLGLVYSLGLFFSPLVLAGGGLSFLSSTLRTRLGRQMKYVEGLAAMIMVTMGISMML